MKRLLILVLIFASSLLCMAADPTPEQESAFLARVSQAITSKDAAAMMNLYCFDRVEPSLREMTQKQLIPELFKGELASAEYISMPSGMADPYTLRGVTYSPNLKPYKALIVRFKKSSPATPDSTTMIVGMKNDSLAIALAAPVSNP